VVILKVTYALESFSFGNYSYPFSGHWQLNITENPTLLFLIKAVWFFCTPDSLLGWNCINEMSEQFLVVQQNGSVPTFCLVKTEAQHFWKS